MTHCDGFIDDMPPIAHGIDVYNTRRILLRCECLSIVSAILQLLLKTESQSAQTI